jgi:pseudaminic acid synthase
MKIGNFDLDKDGVFIIAELSANHNGSLQIALQTIKAAKEAGANAIKLQTYTPDWMTIKVDKDEFRANHLWKDSYLYDLYQKAMTPLEWHKELFSYARSLDLEVFSSPFSKEAVDFLEEFNPVAYKIASFEITDYELVRYTASKQKPIIISTGIATKEEIKDVINICKEEGNEKIIILKCTSSYPTPLEDANLLTIPDIKKTFGVEVGFSDHTLGFLAPVVAVSLGAKVVEKHFILDKSLNSADKDFSMTPDEFKKMVDAIRDTQKLLGEVNYTPKQGNRDYARSLYVVKDVKKNEVITKENVKAIRPGYGLHPKHLNEILGKKFKDNYKKGTRVAFDLIL